MKSWYFERDCPFCTQSASSFCRNPLNFLAHCYVDEMITNKVERVVSSLVVILAIVLAGTVFLGSVFSDLFSKPVTSLVRAMGEFEGNSAEFL